MQRHLSVTFWMLVTWCTSCRKFFMLINWWIRRRCVWWRNRDAMGSVRYGQHGLYGQYGLVETTILRGNGAGLLAVNASYGIRFLKRYGLWIADYGPTVLHWVTSGPAARRCHWLLHLQSRGPCNEEWYLRAMISFDSVSVCKFFKIFPFSWKNPFDLILLFQVSQFRCYVQCIVIAWWAACWLISPADRDYFISFIIFMWFAMIYD